MSATKPPPSGRILPAALCRELQAVLDAANNPILICDGGEFGQWAQACLSAPTRIINGPGGAIGGGLCYAVAAKLNRPEAAVFTLMGDGTTGFHLSEFETALRCSAPFIAVVGHDARWNAEYQIQLRDYGASRLVGCELEDTRYDLAVASLGGHGENVTHPDDLPGALERAMQSGLPASMSESKVFPLLQAPITNAIPRTQAKDLLHRHLPGYKCRKLLAYYAWDTREVQ